MAIDPSDPEYEELLAKKAAVAGLEDLVAGGFVSPEGLDRLLNLIRNAPNDEPAAREETNSEAVPEQVNTWVLALDLEGTLVSNAVSLFPRPGLLQFLTVCRVLFHRIVAFTTVPERRFREVAQLLTEEGSAPAWFTGIEYVDWHGQFKDLTLVPGADISRTLIVDDMEQCIRVDQKNQWIRIEGYEPPFNPSDSELNRVLQELSLRAKTASKPVDTESPPVPPGYASWLDYSVSSMNSRAAVMDHLFSDQEGRWSQGDVQRAARNELMILQRQRRILFGLLKGKLKVPSDFDRPLRDDEFGM